MVRSSSKIRAVLMSFRFWRRCAADPFAVSAAGFNQPAAICACDVMLLRPALFLPATPMNARVLHPFLLIEELCNVVHTRAERVTFRSHPSGQPHTFFFLHAAALQVLLDQSTKANSPLKGHERTVQYLQRLGADQ